VPSLTTLLVFAAATLLLVATPGPGVVYVLAAAAGLTTLLATSATAFDTLRYGGAAYLIVLGIRRWREGAGSLERVAMSRPRLFSQGFFVQLLNPKVAVFFLAYLPQFVSPHHAVAPQVLLLGCVCVTIACASDATYVIAASLVAERLAGSARAQRVLGRFSAATYIALGLIAALNGDRSIAARTA
jgi:threonine/homoserine/homoserine lactone efflux protein